MHRYHCFSHQYVYLHLSTCVYLQLLKILIIHLSIFNMVSQLTSQNISTIVAYQQIVNGILTFSCFNIVLIAKTKTQVL